MVTIRPRRRWFQFSILSLLIFTAVVAFLVARYVVPARRQHDAVAKITGLGGRVYYDYGRNGATGPSGPAWLRGLIGDDFFQRVSSVNLRGEKFDADKVHAALVEVSRLPTLKYLSIVSRSGLDDAHISEISQLKALTGLRLERVTLTDEGLSQLSRLSNLTSLSLNGSYPDAGLAHLAKLDLLTGLELDHVTDKTLAEIAGLRHLQYLALHGVITEAGIAQLEPLVDLQTLAYNSGGVAPRLDTTGSISYQDCSLVDAVEYFGQIYDCKDIRFDHDSIAERQISIDEILCDDTAAGITLRKALERLLSPHGLGFKIEDDALVITSAPDAARARTQILALQKKLPKPKWMTSW